MRTIICIEVVQSFYRLLRVVEVMFEKGYEYVRSREV